MVLYRCRRCRRLHTRSAGRHQPQSLYTPSIDAYQRFERAMVGLDVGAPEGSQKGMTRPYQRRKKG
jgi:hypothetical protein